MSTLALITVFLLTALGQNLQQPTASETTHYPNVLHAELPLYPPLASTMRINGTVKIEVTVEKGAVVDATVKSTEIEFSDPQKNALYDSDAKKKIANQFLSNPSLANLKTWQFRSEDRATFVVTYVYKIEGEETPLPENPKVELDLPRLVKVTARPFKPTCSDCGVQSHSGNGAATVDPKNSNLHLAGAGEHQDKAVARGQAACENPIALPGLGAGVGPGVSPGWWLVSGPSLVADPRRPVSHEAGDRRSVTVERRRAPGETALARGDGV